MKTTLRKVWNANPCGKNSADYGWGLLTNNLGTDDLDTEVTFKQILESNGIKDAIWALRTLDYDDQCLFLADVAELSLPIFESKHPNDDRPRNAINAIRDFKAGEITKEELLAAANAAYAAADAAYTADITAYTADATAAYTAAYTARAAAAVAVDAADAAAGAVDATAGAVDAEAKKKKWEEIEKLFIKYFVKK